MSIALSAPAWLWLLAPVAVLMCATMVARPMRSWAGFARGAVVRVVVVGGLALSLAGPECRTRGAAVSAVALFDVSASVTDAQLAQEARWLAQLRNEGRPPHRLRVVTFAATPTEMRTGGVSAEPGDGPKPADHGATILRRHPDADGMDTDIARALGAAAGLTDPGRTTRVLLMSDGRATRGDALAQAIVLRSMGVRVDSVALEPGTVTDDVAVQAVTAPDTGAAVHTTFPLRIRLATDRAARVRVRLTRDGLALPAPGDSERILNLHAGQTEVSWDVRLDQASPAVFAVQATRMQGRDPHPENDRAVLAIEPQRPGRVLLVAESAEAGAALRAALRAQEMEVQQVVAGAGGAATSAALRPEALAEVDLVVLCDLPRLALSDGGVATLERYVRDGGGLLLTGGPHAFGPGGWDGSRLETLLPVRLDTPQRRDEPALALALVIDRSGSMSGPKMELTKQAALGTAQMLPADDQIAVIAFDSQATTVVPLQRAANRLRVATLISRIQPTGGTNILAGLHEAIDQLSTTPAKKKRAILLSDGQSATAGIAELVDAAVDAHITISTIGVGEGVDDALLQTIARQGGGRYYHTRDPNSIPRIFTREATEVAQSGVVERPTGAVPSKHAAMLAGIPWASAPALRGYVRTHARAQADVLLATEAGDPLLARWTVGLGRSVVWTSDVGPRWTADWTRWPAFAQLWGQVARGAMRARAALQFPLRARLDDAGTIDVTADAAAPNDAFIAGLEATLEINTVGPDGVLVQGTPRRVPMLEAAPGRYSARFEPTEPHGAPPPGSLLLHATFRDQGRTVAEARGQLAIPFAPELMPQAVWYGTGLDGSRLLESVAAATGGHALDTPAALFQGAAPRPVTRSLRPQLLGGLALSFVADIALRRLRSRQRQAVASSVSRG